MEYDIGIDVLLDLNGTEYTEENGYWYKIEAWQIKPTPERPHGIKYNLTLHNNFNERIMGFDNAHTIKVPKKVKGKYNGRIIVYDHFHLFPGRKIIPYFFVSAERLVYDFFNELDKVMNKVMRN